MMMKFKSILRDFNLKVIRLATPTTNRSRLNKILKISSGFLYYVSIAGITGTGLNKLSKLRKLIIN